MLIIILDSQKAIWSVEKFVKKQLDSVNELHCGVTVKKSEFEGY